MTALEELSVDEIVATLRKNRLVMLTATAADGKILAHPMTIQRVEDDATIWLFASRTKGLGQLLAAGRDVNVAVSETGSWLSVAGVADFVEDERKVDELWDDEAGSYFAGGKDDPDLALVKVNSVSAQLWGLPGGRVAALAQIAAARVTGTKAPGGSASIEL